MGFLSVFQFIIQRIFAVIINFFVNFFIVRRLFQFLVLCYRANFNLLSAFMSLLYIIRYFFRFLIDIIKYFEVFLILLSILQCIVFSFWSILYRICEVIVRKNQEFCRFLYSNIVYFWHNFEKKGFVIFEVIVSICVNFLSQF